MKKLYIVACVVDNHIEVIETITPNLTKAQQTFCRVVKRLDMKNMSNVFLEGFADNLLTNEASITLLRKRPVKVQLNYFLTT